MNNWIETHFVRNADDEMSIITEALELPHGCLVRTTTIMENAGKLTSGTTTIATAMVFVPNLKLECQADTVVFKHKL